MNLIDIVVLVVMIPMVIGGISKGFVSQAISFIALFIGTYTAYYLTVKTGDDLAAALGISVGAGNIIVFAVSLLAIWALLALVGQALKKIIQFALLEWVDKVLGGVFALGTTLLVCGLIAIMFDALNTTTFLVDRQYLEDSWFFYRLQNLATTFFPYLHKIIPTAGEMITGALPQ